MMRFSPTIVTAFFTLLQWHKSTAASITFFRDKAAWEEAVGSTNFIIETFEDLPDEFTPSDGGSVRLPEDTLMDFGTEGIEYFTKVGGANPGVADIIDKNKNGLGFSSPVDGSNYLFVPLQDRNDAGSINIIADDASEDVELTISGTAEFLGVIFDPPTFDITLGTAGGIVRGNFDNFQFHFDSCLDDDAKTEPGICGCGVADVDLDSDNDGTPDCIDGCEDDPLKTEAGTCGCGVADIDSDNNGIPDCNEDELDEEDECGVLFTRNCK